ncbi:hypothetical protein [Bifidobacterium psychraerophilum]|nr:hypothetical protein [Bifidobacterium psychraerophilum]
MMIRRITVIWNRYRSLALADRTALGAAGSVVVGVGMASVKLGLGVVTQSVLFIVSAVYYFMLCLSRFVIVYRHRRIRRLHDISERSRHEMSVYHRTGLLLCIVGLSYGFFSFTLMSVEAGASYSDIVAISVAAITVVKIGTAIRGLVVARRERNPTDAAVKAIAFTDALLSVVVMQNVLLLSQHTDGAGKSSGMVGMVLGAGVVVAGLVMFFRTKQRRFFAEGVRRH